MKRQALVKISLGLCTVVLVSALFPQLTVKSLLLRVETLQVLNPVHNLPILIFKKNFLLCLARGNFKQWGDFLQIRLSHPCKISASIELTNPKIACIISFSPLFVAFCVQWNYKILRNVLLLPLSTQSQKYVVWSCVYRLVFSTKWLMVNYRNKKMQRQSRNIPVRMPAWKQNIYQLLQVAFWYDKDSNVLRTRKTSLKGLGWSFQRNEIGMHRYQYSLKCSDTTEPIPVWQELNFPAMCLWKLKCWKLMKSKGYVTILISFCTNVH